MIIHAWTIDWEPAPWSAAFKVSEIQAILAPTKMILYRHRQGQTTLTSFVILVGGKEIPCCRESSNKDIPAELEAKETIAFREELIKRWGEAQ